MSDKSRQAIKKKLKEEIMKRMQDKLDSVEDASVIEQKEDAPEQLAVVSALKKLKGIEDPVEETEFDPIDTFIMEREDFRLIQEAYDAGYAAAFEEEEPVNPFEGTAMMDPWISGYQDGIRHSYVDAVFQEAVYLVMAQSEEEIAERYAALSFLVENNVPLVEDILGVEDEG